MRRDLTSAKTESSSLTTKLDKLQMLEKEFEEIKKEKNHDKFTSIEKDVASLRADHEKLKKEVKYVDSTVKKDSANTKGEIGSFTKTVKDFEKDLNTIHNMIDVLKSDKTGSVGSEDLNKMKTDLTKANKESLDKIKQAEDTITRKI